MFELSFMKILLILVVVFVVFGAGKLPKVMGDIGKGLRHFKDALNDNPPNELEKKETVETVKPEDKKST